MTDLDGLKEQEPPSADVAEAPDRASLARALRNLETAQERVELNAQGVYDERRRELVLALLPVLDNLDRTLAAVDASTRSSFVEGVRMVRAELEGVLFRYGVERVDAEGERFDPAMHEAIAVVPTPDPTRVGEVVAQFAPAYRFAGKLLRAAKVSVGARESGRPVAGRASPSVRGSSRA
jgi:molecular chaperone GrpE